MARSRRRSASMAVGTMTSQKPETEALQAEMKLLNWHKLANEAALKAALLKTKQLKQRDAKSRTSERLRAQASWMQRVIEEEQAKPLHVTPDFVAEYQAREQLEEQRLDDEVTRHISSLKKLRCQIEDRERMRAKKEAYKQARAVHARAQRQEAQVEDKQVGEHKAQPNKGDRVPGTLHTVITSLDRLVDLERRIASLEKDSIYQRVEEATASNGSSTKTIHHTNHKASKRSRTGLQFTKQRIPLSANRPSKDVYAVRLAQRGVRLNRGPTTRKEARTHRQPERNSVTTGDVQQSGSGASSNIHRQDQAINKWLQRRKNLGGHTNSSSRGPVTAPSLGAASGRRGKNAAQQAFFDMKKQVEKRKDNMRHLCATSQSTASKAPSYRRRGTASKISTSSSASSRHTTVSTRRKPVASRMPKINGASTSGISNSRVHGTSHAAKGKPRKVSSMSRTPHALPHVAGGGFHGVRGVRRVR